MKFFPKSQFPNGIPFRGWVDMGELIAVTDRESEGHKPEPTLAGQIVNGTKAAARVARAVILRQPVMVPKEMLAVRRAICDACELWDASGNAGLGKCKHPRCGCSRFKLTLATERCPDGLWERWKPSSPHRSE